MPLHSSTALRVGAGLLALAPALALLGPRGLLVLLGGLALGWLLKPSCRTGARPQAPVQATLDLVGEAAHELGNPLLALQLRLHRLRAHASPDSPLHEGLAQAEKEACRLGLLLRDLLDLSRQS
ncbi:MAG TPA: histidine kinase dimerization/phospho-acceptor domain-containing protein, partial [Myxococcaceae bacterium]|nr:histidine kinase dimerization/phospho-acceptor domain-containing protein [Myxococcaceae bacterium]